jgi:hypothetical protein
MSKLRICRGVLGIELAFGIGTAMLSGQHQSAIAGTAPVTPVEVTLDADAVPGRVLSFGVIRALRNLSFKEGVLADITVSVNGGTQADWMATAAYIAERSIVNGVTHSNVEVFVNSPWGDKPPTLYKKLADARYSPVLKEPWKIYAYQHAGTLADIEYYDLSSESRAANPYVEARKVVIRKYKLSANWQPTANLGVVGPDYGREHTRIVGVDADVDTSMSIVTGCLSMDEGNHHPLQGCAP